MIVRSLRVSTGGPGLSIAPPATHITEDVHADRDVAHHGVAIRHHGATQVPHDCHNQWIRCDENVLPVVEVPHGCHGDTFPVTRSGVTMSYRRMTAIGDGED